MSHWNDVSRLTDFIALPAALNTPRLSATAAMSPRLLKWSPGATSLRTRAARTPHNAAEVAADATNADL
jgi:hypothetical protein